MMQPSPRSARSSAAVPDREARLARMRVSSGLWRLGSGIAFLGIYVALGAVGVGKGVATIAGFLGLACALSSIKPFIRAAFGAAGSSMRR